ncbi:MAG: hypothetical protein J6W76_04070, partial [Spirochaetales bacterium]|nr:hypothetical protein [Spirochaetales bacterium]
MKKNIISVLLLLSSIAILSAATLSGTGSGESEDTAKSLAMQDLTMKISVDVKSRIVDFTEEGGVDKVSSATEYSANLIDLASEMPVLGASFDTNWKPSKSGGRLYTCTVTMDTETSLPLYEKAINEIVSKIDGNIAAAQKKKNTKAKTDILDSVLTDMTQYNKYLMAAIYLGLSNPPRPAMTEAEINAMIKDIQKIADTIDYAGNVIGTKLKKYKN